MAKKKKIDEQELIKLIKDVFQGTEVKDPFIKAPIAASRIGFDPCCCGWYRAEKCSHSYDCPHCSYATAYVKYVLKLKKKKRPRKL